MADRRPLMRDNSDQPDTPSSPPPVLPSLGFSTQYDGPGFGATHADVSPPTSPPDPFRPTYARLRSDTGNGERNAPATVHEAEEEDIADSFHNDSREGLGIASQATTAVNTRASVQTIPRIVEIRAPRSPIGSPDALNTPQTGDPLYGGFPQDSAESTPDLRRERFSPRDTGGSYNEFGARLKSQASLDTVDDYQQYLHASDTQSLRPGGGAPSFKSGRSARSAYDNDFRPTQECPTSRDFYISRWSWISITIVIICLFSTVFSGIFLGLAIKAPRYGRSITSQGSFKPSDAITLTQIMAKLIELSFVTSFVAFLGQVLSRRAFMREQGRGVTLSELNMWRWVVQPGSLITHWETAVYAGVSVLGILSLLSALLATMYTTAAVSVVQPTLKFGKWDHKMLAGNVRTDFANVDYVKDLCETPITEAMDKAYSASTCLQIEHAGQGYHNYQRYLAYWKEAGAVFNNGTTNQKDRPPGFGLLYENTTISAEWINVIDTPAVSKAHKRAINNVSLAMPHAGVFQAARDQRNDILQPEELDSEGSYFLRASVPSPVMNVLCANMEEDELAPIVYQEWNGEDIDGPRWNQLILLGENTTTTNDTKVDDIFGWTKKNPAYDYPPVFAKLPKPFNTILNNTRGYWGRDAIYLLGQGGADEAANRTGTYVLCKIRVTLTPDCRTEYNATGSAGTMSAHCEDPDDELAYIKSNATAQKVKSLPGWFDIGYDWSSSLSLNNGIDDGSASNARLLTQLILQPTNSDTNDLKVDLSDRLPSVAEALAVMSGCTLLKTMTDAPFTDFWNHTVASLDEPFTEYFNATIMAQQYASGGPDHVSRGWIIVLLMVFLMDCFILVYFLFHKGLVTDFSEPPNMFALTINSPPSRLLEGSCGGGPVGKQFKVNWFVNTEGDHLYMEPGEKPVQFSKGPGGHHHAHPHHHGPAKSRGVITAVTGWFNDVRERGLHIGSRKTQTLLRPVSVADDGEGDYELEDGSTRTRRQYDKLSKRRSML